MSTETVSAKKINETFLHIDCPRSISYELIDFFSFYVDGYRFMKDYKDRVWDGKIRLFNRNCTLYVGLFKHLAHFCRQNGYRLEFDSDEIFESIPVEDAMEYANSLTYMNDKGEEITPRDYQHTAYQECLKRGRRTILSSTNSGKSLMIYMVCHYLLHRKKAKKVLIVVPTTTLVQQMKGDFCDYAQADDWDPESDLHEIRDGRTKENPDCRVYVSTWQSVFRQPRKYLQQFDVVIGDEVHEFEAKSCKSLMEKCVNAKWRFGFTGTLKGTKMNKLTVEGLFGPTIRVMTNKDSIDRGESSEIDIRMQVLRWSEEQRSDVYGKKYQDEVKWLRNHPRRNSFIAGSVLSRKKTENSLILVNNLDQAKSLFDLIRKYDKHRRKVFLVTGSSDTEHRNEVRELVNNSLEDDPGIIIIATFKVFQRGINIKTLHNIFFGSPTKSVIRVLQSIGRGLRVSAIKERLVLWDIVDDLSGTLETKNYSWIHGNDRIAIYRKEEFPVTVSNIPI